MEHQNLLYTKTSSRENIMKQLKIFIFFIGILSSTFAFSSAEGAGAAKEKALELLKNSLEQLEKFLEKPNSKSVAKTHTLLLHLLNAGKIPGIREAFLFDEEFSYITPFGLSLVETFFKKEQGGSWTEAEIKYYSYEKIINYLLKNQERDKEGEYFIINYNDPDFPDPHLTPVAVSFRENDIDIFLFDSIGIKKNSHLLDELERLLVELNESSPLSKKFNFFFNSQERQKDSFSCPVFSYIDIRNLVEINFLEDPKIQNILKENSPLHKTISETISFYSMDILPPLLMRKCQSCKAIQKMDSKTAAAELEFQDVYVRRSFDGSESLIKREAFNYLDPLLMTHGVHSPTSSDKILNFYTQEKWLKFVNMILLSLQEKLEITER